MKRAVISLVVVFATVAAGQPVAFQDAALKTAVETQLHVSNPTKADMLKLVYLVAPERGIAALTGLEHAANLATLNLNYNSVHDLSPLSGLVSLTRLFLDGNGLDNVSSLAKLTKLQFLTLAENEIADISPLAGLTGLTELNLASNRVRQLQPLGRLLKLVSLDVSANNLWDISALACLANLNNLNASYNEITEVTSLTPLTKLVELDLGLNRISEITPLAGLTALSRLHLGNNRIADIAPLTRLTHLTVLAIEYDNPLLPVAYCRWIPQIQRNNPGLTLFYDHEPTRTPGDASGDCRMNLLDFAMLAASWLQFSPQLDAADFNRDYVVDFRDLSLLADNWLGPIIIREFRFDGSPGWTTQGQWSFGRPEGRGGLVQGHADPNSGGTGANLYGVNPAGDYTVTPGGPYYLTTGPIDCSGFHNVTLTFARWLNTDDPAHVRSTVEVCTDGKSWQTIWRHDGTSPLADSAWTPVHYDLSAIADGRAEVRFRWGYEILAGARPYSGWNLDDVVLRAHPSVETP